MEKLFKTIHNLETGEITQVELTAEDLAVMAADKIEAEAIKAAQQQAEADKAALLAKLGITADEAKLLLS
jgi:hypothetical protein